MSRQVLIMWVAPTRCSQMQHRQVVMPLPTFLQVVRLVAMWLREVVLPRMRERLRELALPSEHLAEPKLALLQQELVRQLRLVVQQLLKLVARRQEVPPLQVQQQAELLPVAQLLQEEQGVQLLVVVASLSWEA